MGRIMAIDYGGKRTGIAVTDPLQITSNGLTTVKTDGLMNFLKDYFNDEPVDCVVVGQPFHKNNEPSQSSSIIEDFINKFKISFPNMPIDREDESNTSKLAVNIMVQAGLKKKKRRDKSLVDQISATLILQRYMERNSL